MEDGVNMNFSAMSGGPVTTDAARGRPLPPLGRVIQTLLAAESRSIEQAALHTDLSRQGLIGRMLTALAGHSTKAVQQGNSLDAICRPLLEHAVKSKDPSNKKRVSRLFTWLLAGAGGGVPAGGMPFVKCIVETLKEGELDHRVKLGSCVVIRALVDGGAEVVQARTCENGLNSTKEAVPAGVAFSHAVPALVQIVTSCSTKGGKRRLPTRLTLAAADCALIITRHLAISSAGGATESGDLSTASPGHSARKSQGAMSLVTMLHGEDEVEVADVHGVRETTEKSGEGGWGRKGGRQILWDELESLLALVAALNEWNEGQRVLYQQGLAQVLLGLQSLALYKDSLQQEEGQAREQTGPQRGQVSLEEGSVMAQEMLAARWQHYSQLMMWDERHLERSCVLMARQWLQTLEYYGQKCEELPTERPRGGSQRGAIQQWTEMQLMAITCLTLLIGRLDERHLAAALQELQGPLVRSSLKLMTSANGDLLDLAIAIFRVMIFRPLSAAGESSPLAKKGHQEDDADLAALLPSMMGLLDGRDSAARALVLLAADLFAANPHSAELEALFGHLDSESNIQRSNALEVIAELLMIARRQLVSADATLSQQLLKHLLPRLGDKELFNCVQASALFPKLAPEATLPPLLHLLYSPVADVHSSARQAVAGILREHPNKCCTISVLIDSMQSLMAEIKSSPSPASQQDGTKAEQAMSSRREKTSKGPSPSTGVGADFDRVVPLIPDWASSLEEGDWPAAIAILLRQMWREPSSPLLPAILSRISTQLGEQAHLVLPLVAAQMGSQPALTERRLVELAKDENNLAAEVFSRLSPLLVLKVLPVVAFSASGNSALYGEDAVEEGFRTSPMAATWGNHTSVGVALQKLDLLPEIDQEGAHTIMNGSSGKTPMASMLFERMCGLYEFEEVRKVAAELVGRLLPHIMLPVVVHELERGAASRDLLKVKACLFAICTSLMIRGPAALVEPWMMRIRRQISAMLTWPCPPSQGRDGPGSKVAKVQHGCMDCLAIMIRAQLLQSAREPPVYATSSATRAKATQTTSASTVQPFLSLPAHQKMKDTRVVERGKSREAQVEHVESVQREEGAKDRHWLEPGGGEGVMVTGGSVTSKGKGPLFVELDGEDEERIRADRNWGGEEIFGGTGERKKLSSEWKGPLIEEIDGDELLDTGGKGKRQVGEEVVHENAVGEEVVHENAVGEEVVHENAAERELAIRRKGPLVVELDGTGLVDAKVQGQERETREGSTRGTEDGQESLEGGILTNYRGVQTTAESRMGPRTDRRQRKQELLVLGTANVSLSRTRVVDGGKEGEANALEGEHGPRRKASRELEISNSSGRLIELLGPLEGERADERRGAASACGDKTRTADDGRREQQDVLQGALLCLTGAQKGVPFLREPPAEATVSFRVCMANVLISACQKVPTLGRHSLARSMVPPVTAAAQGAPEDAVRGACLQVLFTAVHCLGAAPLVAYAADLLGVAMAALRHGQTDQERIGGGKLLVALLASDEPLVAELIPYLAEVRRIVANVACLDQSLQLQALCEQLTTCLPPPMAGVKF